MSFQSFFITSLPGTFFGTKIKKAFHQLHFEMNLNWNERTRLLLGEDAVGRLAASRVLVVGVGGVGAYAVEMLVRAGVGHITIVDGDSVSVTNLNRQLPALHSTLDCEKVDVMKHRIKDINPEATVSALKMFITAETVPQLLAQGFDYVIDAIDSIAPKVALIEYCLHEGIGIISSMGAGGRLDPTAVKYADIADTCHDGLAKAVRVRLREHGIRRGLMTVWSNEPPVRSSLLMTDGECNKRSSYGTVSYMPCVFGCMLAAHVIKKLSNI